MIVRGAGKCFSSGYELGTGNEGQELPWFTPGGEGHFPRHVTQGWMSIWEFAKPVIAQVHGQDLEQKVLGVAQRIATMPPDIVQLNKRVVHRQMEIMGLRTGIRAGTELCALGLHQKSIQEFMTQIQKEGLTGALQGRDQPFGDYRTTHAENED